MNQIFPLPIYTFLKMTINSGGISPRRIKNLIPWLLKTTLFEPLRWVEVATQHKRIAEHTINKHPIFILGFYRSGTSYLHHFLTQDDRFGYHSVYQMVFPEIMLSCEKWMSPILQSVSRLLKVQDPVHRIPLNWKYPAEEDGAMTTSVNPRGAQWGYFFPKIMNEHFCKYVLLENIPNSELELWKSDFLFLLKKISIANEGRQLVLKSPPNTARIKVLLSLFPHAKFIYIHRHPNEVYLSNKNFWRVTQSLYAVGPSESIDTNSIILDTYTKMIDRYLVEKDLVPEGNLVEIAYEDLLARPPETMQNVYEKLGFNNFQYCREKMAVFAEGQQNFVRLKYQMPEPEKKLVTKKLERFITHWNYPLW